jgi:Ca2+-binding RTX toxin-like protein
VSFIQSPGGYLYVADLVNGRVARLNISMAPPKPVFTSNEGSPNATVWTAENSLDVTVLTAADFGASKTLTYSIAGGDDAFAFVVNPATGVLRFAKAPDFETPLDRNGDNVYEVVVRVKDGNGGTAEQAIAVHISNVDGETIRGTGKADVIDAVQSVKSQARPASENDIIRGRGGKDMIQGLGGDDKIFGGKGRDVLSGGEGSDILNGGGGRDRFVFDTALGPKNIDTIRGFSPADDKIVLSHSVFSAIGGGDRLHPNKFWSHYFEQAPHAHDAGDRIIYNSRDGSLWYDPDGNTPGGQAPVQFAVLPARLWDLSSWDFSLIG